ncbi:MAG: polysaccharide deacetylase family protein [Pseudomonadota bacterium]|nr:polysaccharide deacetylase family protein [Pseudomonadota bacterium]
MRPAIGLALATLLLACGGGSDPFYQAPTPPPAPASPFGASAPIARAPIAALPAPVRQPPAGPRVLVLYDEPEANPYARLGKSYAIALQNLLGHFDADVQAMPVARYANGDMRGYHATFYIAWTTGLEIPAAFLHDAAFSGERLIWLRGNLEQLNQLPGFSTAARWGFEPRGSRFFDTEPDAPATHIPGFYSTVHYKHLAFKKTATIYQGAVSADPHVALTEVTQAHRNRVHAVIANPATGATAPYVLQSGTFWHVADLPLHYTSPTDRYLVFADLLHDMLGIDHPASHQAMVRLEDIDAKVVPGNFKPVVDYLHAQGVPFSLAVIPHYRDPYGTQNNGVPTDIPLAQATMLRMALDYALARGGEILQHGYTHQSDHYRNGQPGNGASGFDYEFWDVPRNAPLPGDSPAWALARVNAGLRALLDQGFAPVAWETPHYIGSPSVLRAVSQVFQSAYQRHTYYTSDTPDLTPGPGADFEIGQFFPYLIERDIYGLRVLPENLGNLQYHAFGAEHEITAREVLEYARYARAVRDGFGSFFFHPFLAGAQAHGRGLHDLQQIVEGLQAMGYTWTSPSRLNAPR